MELQNVDVLERGRKRKASGYDYMRSRQESVEVELDVEKREKRALSNLLEKAQRSVKRLTEQLTDAEGVVEEHARSVNRLTEQLKDAEGLVAEHARNVKRLTDDLMNRDTRVMNLEAENYIMSAKLHDLEVKVSVDAKFQEKCTHLELEVVKLAQSEKEQRKRWKKHLSKKRQHKWRTKKQVLKAFQWEESTADAALLRAVCGFWKALNLPEMDVDEIVTNAGEEIWAMKKRMSQGDVRNMWKEVTLNG